MRSWLDLRSFLLGLRISWGRPYKQEVAGSNPAAPIELTGFGVPDVRYLCPLNGPRTRLPAVLQRLPELVLVGLLVASTEEPPSTSTARRRRTGSCAAFGRSAT